MLTRPTQPRWRCLLGALLLLSACSGSEQVAVQRPVTPAEVNAFLEEVLDTAPALSYSDLVERLGPPIRVKVEPAAPPNAATPPDTLRTLIYLGLELTITESATSPASPPTRVALTDARYTSPEGLRVGYAESQVLRTLGLPTQREPARLIYEKAGPQHCVLVVFLERRSVSRMEWRFNGEGSMGN